MLQRSLGRLFGNAAAGNEVETSLSRRQMLGVTGLFLLTAPVVLRPGNAIASVIKPAPVGDGLESDLTNVPFKPAEDGAEVIEVGRRRRRRRARRGRRRHHARRRSRYHYGHSHGYRRRRRRDFCFWGPWGGFCVD